MNGLQPSLEDFCAHAGPESAALVTLTLLADTETPVSAYARLGGGAVGAGPSLLLESVEGGERLGRYSFFAAGIERSLRIEGDRVMERNGATVTERALATAEGEGPLEAVRAALPRQGLWSPRPLPPLCAGAVGLFAFDLVRALEPVPLPTRRSSAAPPDIALLLPDVLCAFDHVTRQLLMMTTAGLGADRTSRCAEHAAATARLESALQRLQSGAQLAPWPVGDAAAAPTAPVVTDCTPRAAFEAAVVRAQEAIAAGEIFQVVLSRRFEVEAEIAPLALYRALRAINPSPYMFLLDFGDFALVGASPEVLVRVEDGQMRVRPIAGTRRRGQTPDEDIALAEELLADPKELAEHRMLLDLGRNDVSRVTVPGSVVVEDPLHIERYSHVMHLVSDVRGRLRPECDALDALRAAFPAGTVSGAPKVRALEWIAALEPIRRGAYAGAVGYLDVRGHLDTAIAIRTLVVEPTRVVVQAGAGVVADSVPAHEADECEAKARAALRAISIAVAQQTKHPSNTES